ncbi:MAG: class A beta-lactamase [Mesorhizobium sp.]|uniref:class A beta-lactamase n=1 Tax=Mesorhizobium sp. TaxID=1871066 RepID=UPI000FE4CD5A|nr:class A beta-lactamase [Mesorhizobium sp.]RWH82179.1 MAG: class A beta-lactamase [Mesorhizobium sp.]RWH85180.1 MAG: class A beta-lactamase [Mesorhizobium sp.]RWH89935.1 MAG: class A beta-lactamase [Mesorhizobium sp.]RWH98315.1 MAG: class A beta-lactamase [Mesorhizobium sp.]RWI04677.1 MAG: class A beta-lactamase [Mesorhizobium sp.]
MSKKVGLTAAFAILVTLAPTQLIAGGLADRDRLHSELAALADAHPGRVGICVQDETSPPICVNGEQRFSLQSVMKVIVAAAVMKAADERRIALEDRVTIRREDLSVNIQPIADIVAERGSFETSVGDLVRRAVVESDSAATDVLISHLGGVNAVQAFLDEAGLRGIRIDRTERELQTETDGLTWTPEFVFPERLEQAREEVSDAKRQTAFEAYLKDPRDTATPRDMVGFLHRLATGQLLSASSTAHLLEVMNGTVTFPDRLRAGAPSGWTIGHKTGTSQTRNGVNGVTNDVGILTAPDGGRVAVAAFVAESRAGKDERAATIAAAARAITAAYE